MTVYDLIQVLAQYPPDAVVMYDAIVSKRNKPVDLVFREAVHTCNPIAVYIKLMED